MFQFLYWIILFHNFRGTDDNVGSEHTVYQYTNYLETILILKNNLIRLTARRLLRKWVCEFQSITCIIEREMWFIVSDYFGIDSFCALEHQIRNI